MAPFEGAMRKSLVKGRDLGQTGFFLDEDERGVHTGLIGATPSFYR
jgi:hypothetical protein